ncbi:MAG: hypothetical protein CL613_08650 [Aquimarina sp.]|nr:hypothetical protein [Aquimarina sp.]
MVMKIKKQIKRYHRWIAPDDLHEQCMIWLSDLKFMKEEQLFFDHLVQKYNVNLIKPKNYLEGKDILNRLDTVREKLPTLFTKLINHSNNLSVLVDGKDEPEKERFFKDEHKQMVTMLSEYLSEYNTLKQQIFKLIIEIKKSDKPKRLLN